MVYKYIFLSIAKFIKILTMAALNLLSSIVLIPLCSIYNQIHKKDSNKYYRQNGSLIIW